MSDIIDKLILREGGFVDHKFDKGGATCWGITAATLGAYRNLGRDASPIEVRNLTKEEARKIYEDQYIFQPKFNLIKDEKLKEFCVDFGVNSGPSLSIEALQKALGVVSDGVIGPKTIAALEASDAETIFKRVFASRIKLIGNIVSRNHSQIVFLNGWLNRVLEFL